MWINAIAGVGTELHRSGRMAGSCWRSWGAVWLKNYCPSARSPRVRLLTPEKALAQLRRIQRHSVRINQAEPITGISTINDIQALVLQTLNIKKPTNDAQLTLL